MTCSALVSNSTGDFCIGLFLPEYIVNTPIGFIIFLGEILILCLFCYLILQTINHFSCKYSKKKRKIKQK
jgi:F0F1-type ATP synthase assembly protein I